MDPTALLGALVAHGASDLHCKVGSRPALRVGGDLVRADELAGGPGGSPLSAEEVARFVEALLTADQHQVLRREGSVVATHSEPGVGRFRVAAFRQRGSVSVVVHAVPHEVRTLDELGLPPAVAALASAERGLVLVASPVGGGVTSTLAGMVDHINRTRSWHVVTVEDPAEVLHHDRRSLVSQLEVPTDVGSLADGVQAAPRLDADVVAISDIAQRDVALAALDAVARGTLVLGAIGAGTTRGAVDALLELFAFEERPNVRQTLARSLTGIVAQRLLPGTDDRLQVVAEVLVGTPKVQAALADERAAGTLPALLAEGAFHGMQTLDQALVGQVRAGRLDETTALAAAVDPEELRIELLRA